LNCFSNALIICCAKKLTKNSILYCNVLKILIGYNSSLLWPTIKSKPVVTYGKPIKGIIKPISPAQAKPYQNSGMQGIVHFFLNNKLIFISCYFSAFYYYYITQIYRFSWKRNFRSTKQNCQIREKINF
jgi:hypothetical protein